MTNFKTTLDLSNLTSTSFEHQQRVKRSYTEFKVFYTWENFRAKVNARWKVQFMVDKDPQPELAKTIEAELGTLQEQLDSRNDGDCEALELLKWNINCSKLKLQTALASERKSQYEVWDVSMADISWMVEQFAKSNWQLWSALRWIGKPSANGVVRKGLTRELEIHDLATGSYAKEKISTTVEKDGEKVVLPEEQKVANYEAELGIEEDGEDVLAQEDTKSFEEYQKPTDSNSEDFWSREEDCD